jgi:hypothetical protein
MYNILGGDIMKKFFLGFLTAALLFSALPVGAAIKEYTLKPASAKFTVDGVEIKDDKLPLLYLNPGYNYIPAAMFKKICDKINVGFGYNSTTKAMEITTKTTTIAGGDNVSEVPLNKYGLPDFSNYTGEKPVIEDDGLDQYFTYEGIKYIRLGRDENRPSMVTRPYGLNDPPIDNEGNRKIILAKTVITEEAEESIIILDEIPYAMYDGFRTYYIPYDYYLNTILPLIQ